MNNYILFDSLGLMNFNNPLSGEDDEVVSTICLSQDAAAEISCNLAAGV